MGGKLVVSRKTKGERDRGLPEGEIVSRLRHEAGCMPEAAYILEHAAECIERLVQFRDSVLQSRIGREAEIVRRGVEIDRQKKIIDDYAAICKSYESEIKDLRRRVRA